ncbi:MAG: hypothetical protein NTZ65_02135 [Candidatus Berkelbacteria bacterium]|nr:hypothetical protein [Candidatus Berkelbacteria bacterium]
MPKEKKKPARNALHSNAGGEMTIDDLAQSMSEGFRNVQKQFKNVQKQIDNLALITGEGFNDTQKQINNLYFEQKEFRAEASGKFFKLEKDMVWVKEILEGHTGILKDLDEERIFVIHRTDRIEDDVEIIKKRLKVV